MPVRGAWERCRAGVAVLLAAWLFWLVLRGACLALFAQRDPRIVGQLWPVPTLALLHEAHDLPADAPEARALNARAARADPLASAPFVDAARAAAAAGDAVRAVHLLEAARDRAPRAAVVQLELLRQYVPLGMTDAAVDAADRAMRLARAPGVVARLAPAIAHHAARHGAQTALARALARRPGWARYVAGPDTDALTAHGLAALVAEEAEPDPARRRRAARSAHIAALLARGDVRAATNAFDGYLAADGALGSRGAAEPYDRDFHALSGPPPLNWRMRPGAGGGAAIRFDDGRRDGYLRADLNGTGGSALAEQAMLLAPGSYRLRTRVRALGGGAVASGAAWRVTCHEQGATLALLSLAADRAWRDGAVSFVVPPRGCAVQVLALVPQPTGMAGALAIDMVRVVPDDLP